VASLGATSSTPFERRFSSMRTEPEHIAGLAGAVDLESPQNNSLGGGDLSYESFVFLKTGRSDT
jgi:hypothetical protein